ncbi:MULTISPECIES: aldolase DeoC/FbaB family protein [Verrucomicrobium]|uniref:class I fructose-bisphosphate aldolase n=1 Tax=Verrucomicrobium TaxID=2735 RepID=UPI0001745AFD|nr:MULTISPECIES: aldolase DeoC/FbaB family protein [Verrucomicrobium]
MSRQDNLETFFRDGKTVILPIDHGVAIPVPGLENPFQLIEDVNPYVDGYVLNLGLALRTGDMLTGKGICLRTDVYNVRTTGKGAGSINIYGLGEAEMVGATGVMNMLFPFSENEELITQNCADLISESLDVDIPVILETLPYGLGQKDKYTVENIGFAVRLAAEMGADVVKTAYPTNGTVEDFKRIVESCYAPVIVLGGAADGNDLDLLSMVHDAMKAGAAGIAIGRNVWQHRSPAAIARSLAAIVHEGAKVDQALTLLKEPV